MFDIGMWELMVVGVVALIVVGPKDLPKMFRTLGQMTGRLKAMAREFQTTMNAAASESGLDDISNDIRGAADFGKDLRNMANPGKMGKDALKKAGASMDKWSPKDGEEPKTDTERLARERADAVRERADAVRERAEAARASVAARNPLPDTPPADAPPPPESGSEATEQ
jgi:sec-independent protein translocase protein TatB